MRLAAWLLRALLFLVLFAFALNNQQPVAVQGFFGTQWQTSLAWVLLLAFAAGALLGVLAMLPRWWRARLANAPGPAAAPEGADSQAPAQGTGLPVQRGDPAVQPHPPRLGL